MENAQNLTFDKALKEVNETYLEIAQEIQQTRFICDIPPLEKKCLVALHRHEIDREQYNKLRLDCADRLVMLC